MRKLTLAIAGVAAMCFVATAAIAGNGINMNGKHYNLNIIGVENPKKSDMTDSQRHSIFVPLTSTKGNGAVSTCAANTGGLTLNGSCTAIVDNPIYLQPAADFEVCDGNGFDAAYACNGDQIAQKGAVFSLPCNTNLTDADINYECPADSGQSYTVWARAVGKPGGEATITTCATVNDLGGEVGDTPDALYCSLENTADVLVRKSGKPVFNDVTDELTSMLLEYCASGFYYVGETLSCDGPIKTVRVPLFASGTDDWFWNYDNNGLRVAQLRFYLNE